MWTQLATTNPQPDRRGTLSQRRRQASESSTNYGAQEKRDDGTYQVQTTVECDVYGACFIVAMRALRDQKLGTVITAYFWVALNFVLTSLIMYGLVFYQEPAFAAEMGKDPSHSQDKMKDQLQEALTGAKPLAKDSPLIKACADQPQQEFVLLVHFIWGSRVLGQFSQVFTLATMIWSIPEVSMRHLTVMEENGDIIVTGKVPFDGYMFGLFLVMPKLVLGVVLYLAGTRNLMLSTDFWDLIFRAVSLWYCAMIEKQIFVNFVSHSKKDWVRKSWVVQERHISANFLRSWPSEVARMIFAFALLVGAAYVSGADTQLRDLCHDCMNMCPINTCLEGSKPCP